MRREHDRGEQLRIAAFEESHLDAAAALLAETQRAGAVELGLVSKLADATAARRALEANLGAGPAVAALEGHSLIGFLIAPLPNVQGPAAARLNDGDHAADPARCRDVYRRLYEAVAGPLVAGGCFDHSFAALTTPADAVAALFELGFGVHQVKGARSLAGFDGPSSSSRIRPAQPEDMDALVQLAIELQKFHARSPMLGPALFSVPSVRRALSDAMAADRSAVLVAVDGDRLVGMIEASPDARYARSVVIGMNVVTEAARSDGLGTTMLTALLTWARDASYEHCTVSWRSANLISDAFYRSRGFEPVRYRLQRQVDPRVAWANEALDYDAFRLE